MDPAPPGAMPSMASTLRAAGQRRLPAAQHRRQRHGLRVCRGVPGPRVAGLPRPHLPNSRGGGQAWAARRSSSADECRPRMSLKPNGACWCQIAVCNPDALTSLLACPHLLLCQCSPKRHFYATRCKSCRLYVKRPIDRDRVGFDCCCTHQHGIRGNPAPDRGRALPESTR